MFRLDQNIILHVWFVSEIDTRKLPTLGSDRFFDIFSVLNQSKAIIRNLY